MFLILIIVGPIYFIVGVLLFQFPPKKINSLYGYRTNQSMKNQKVWDYAQKKSAKEMMKVGLTMGLFSTLDLIFVIPEIWGVIAGLAMLIVLSVGLLLKVERNLRMNFKE
ncbi:MAG: SdpI family protein [Crocinitomicaceae bacterium]